MWDLTLRLEHIAGSGSKELQSSAIAKSWVAQLLGDTGVRNHSILEVDEEWNIVELLAQPIASLRQNSCSSFDPTIQSRM